MELILLSNLKLYCASLIGYHGNVISNQTTHLVAKDDTDAYNKSVKIFQKMYKDPTVKQYISCIEIRDVEGYKISIV